MNTEIKPPKGTGSEYQAWVARATGRNLPVLIDKPCQYRTRDGSTVEIYTIKPPETATANCIGYWLKTTPTGRIKRVFSFWQPNGRFVFLGENPKDIVSKIRSF